MGGKRTNKLSDHNTVSSIGKDMIYNLNRTESLVNLYQVDLSICLSLATNEIVKVYRTIIPEGVLSMGVLLNIATLVTEVVVITKFLYPNDSDYTELIVDELQQLIHLETSTYDEWLGNEEEYTTARHYLTCVMEFDIDFYMKMINGVENATRDIDNLGERYIVPYKWHVDIDSMSAMLILAESNAEIMKY